MNNHIDDGQGLEFTAQGLEAYIEWRLEEKVAAWFKAGVITAGPNASPELKAASGSRVFRVHRDENGRIVALEAPPA